MSTVHPKFTVVHAQCGRDTARPLRLRGRRRHCDLAVRAAGTAGASQRRCDRRPSPPARNRRWSRADVQRDDRRSGERRRRRRAWIVRNENACDRAAHRVRDRDACACARRPRRCAVVPARSFRPARRRQRLLVRCGGRRRARVPLRTVRGTDPGCGDYGQFGIGQRDRNRDRICHGVGRRAARARAGRAGVVRPRAQCRPRACAAARARRGDAGDRARDGARLRRPLPDSDRRQTPGDRREPDALTRGLGTCQAPAGGTARPLEVRRQRRHPAVQRHRRAATQGHPVGPPQAWHRSGVHGKPALVQYARRDTPDARRSARAGCAGRLLDLHLHQLHSHVPGAARAPSRIQQGRTDDRRRPLAGVRLREGRRQRRRGDQAERPALRRSPGQRPRYLERLGQPLLARQVPDRRRGSSPLYALRGGRRQGD